MQDWLKTGISLTLLAGVVWQFAAYAKRYGGWKAIRETGAYWFLLLIVVSFGAGLYLSSDLPRGDMSRATRALLALGSMAAVCGGLVGLWWRLESGQLRRFLAKYAELRGEGHLADDPDVPLRATSVEELERLEARMWEAQVALKGVPKDRARSLENAPDLIERDLRRIDDALDEARALRAPAAHHLAR
jgi:hypothetical protein